MATYTDQFVVYESGAIKKIAVGDTLQVTSHFHIEDGAYDLDIKSHDGTNGLKLDGTLVSATAAELNALDGATSDNDTADKALILDGNGDLGLTNNLTVSGNLTVNGTTTTIATTNTTVSDNLLELNSGAASNANDSGIIIERGSTGDNAIIAWDESADGFVLGTTTATADSTGDLTITAGPLAVGSLSIAGTTLDSDIATLAVPANTTISVFGASLVGDADAATARTTLGLVIGTNVQAWDTQLDDIAGLTPTDGNIIVGNGSNFVAESGATARASLGLAIGTDVQAYDAELAAVAGLTSSANKIIKFTGTGTAGLLDFVDEDNMASDSETAIPSQQSVKAYVDTATANIAGSTISLDNNTGSQVDLGTIVSLSSGGSGTVGDLVVASPSTHPIGVMTANATNTSAADVAVAWGQRVSVKLGSSATVVLGDAVYLISGGVVDATAPTSGYVYRIGFATELVDGGSDTSTTGSGDADGLIEILWMPQFIADLG